VQKGYRLRSELVPILETFGGLLMISLSVDPSLFRSPKDAYLYMRKRRCLALTMQDLRRASCLFSPRYFYVVEWQKETLQAHFHVLLDASFVPHELLLASWSKHRPAWAGPPVASRPAFGTAWISKPRFAGGPVHAARYATKYLIKVPENGFPDWVLEMGADERVKRYSTSRPFWGREAKPASSVAAKRRRGRGASYSTRIAGCEETSTLFEVRGLADLATGEVNEYRLWLSELSLPSWRLSDVPDARGKEGTRRLVLADSVCEVLQRLHAATGSRVHCMRWAKLWTEGQR